MKTLLLLRHAKSSWDEPGLEDHDRPLNERGRRDAPKIGEMLRIRSIIPDLILSSTSKRARKTARKVANSAGFSGELRKIPELYLAHPGELASVINQLVEDPKTLMLVGHNPGIEEFASHLSGHSLIMPTSCVVQLTSHISSWTQFTMASPCELVMIWTPKDKATEY